MIGSFLKGDKQAGKKLLPIIWGQNGIGTLAKKRLARDFSEELNLILIQLFVEEPKSLGVPNAITTGRVFERDKSISVKVPLTENDMTLPESELKELVVSKTGQAIDLVAASLGGKVDIDFDELKRAFLRIVRPKVDGEFRS